MKFLISRTETRTYLQVWRPDAHILSHYLWSPGSNIQKNANGIWCSLLYQLLSNSGDLMHWILETHPQLQRKDSYTDWDAGELAQLTKETLQVSGHAYCVFIDGLDEICQEDGPDTIIKLVDNLRSVGSIKICVSSRPEPAFKRRLGNCPQLSIHDVTERDIRRFAEGILCRDIFSPTMSKSFREDIIDALVRKANGVFLWAALVAEDLRRGAENGDADSELRERLEAIPGDLFQLFNNMWSRLTEGDRRIYTTRATGYFSLILSDTNTPFSYSGISVVTGGSFSVLEFMFASNFGIHATTCESFSAEDLKERCEAVIRDISIACAGLLEVDGHNDHWFNAPLRGGKADMDCLVPYLWRAVRVIHRSVYDFLTCPEKDQVLQISLESTRADCAIRRFKASLAIHRVLDKTQFQVHLKSFLFVLHHLQTFLPHDQIKELVDACHFAVSREYICYTDYVILSDKLIMDPKVENYPRRYMMDFNVYVAQYGLRDVVNEYAESHKGDSRALAVYLQSECTLRGVEGIYGLHNDKDLEYTLQSIQFLLDLGADPTMRMLPPFGADQYSRIHEPHAYFDLSPPLSILLSKITYLLERRLYYQTAAADRTHHVVPSYLGELRKTVDKFYECGVDRDLRVPVVSVAAFSTGFHRYLMPLRSILGSYPKIIAGSCLCLVLEIPIKLLDKWIFRVMLEKWDQIRLDLQAVRVVAFSETTRVTRGHIEGLGEFYKVDSPQDSAMIFDILAPPGLQATRHMRPNMLQLKQRLPVLQNHLEYFRELGWCAPMDESSVRVWEEHRQLVR